MERPKVLIVDDSSFLCEGLSLLLAPDYRVASARTGEEALRIIEEFEPDVVLLDLKLPGIMGEELLRFLRRHRPWVRVVVISGIADPEAPERTFRMGAREYLRKPFGLGTLRNRLEEILQD